MIVRNIPAMCVTHNPIIEVLDFTPLVGWLVGIDVWVEAEWFPVQMALLLLMVLHTVHIVALVHSLYLLVLCHIHVCVLRGSVDT